MNEWKLVKPDWTGLLAAPAAASKNAKASPFANYDRGLIDEIVIPDSDSSNDNVNRETDSASASPPTYVLRKSDWVPERKSPVSLLHHWLTVIQPWGIALALIAFALDYNARVEARTRGAWEVLALSGSGDNGKSDALEFLNSKRWFKSAKKLTGINLGTEEGEAGTFLRKVRLPGADLRRSNFQGADLTGANLSGVLWQQSILSRANLMHANLSRAHLALADLSKANLFAADLKGTNLAFAKNLTQQQLNDACGDHRTRLTNGLLIPMCSRVSWYKDFHGDQPDETTPMLITNTTSK